jgi:DNA-binding transcriptional ArsR family regulator
MGLTKSELFSEKQIEIANLFKALSNPARIAIIEELNLKNSCICGELVSEIKLSQSTISQHLKELKDAGFIKGTIEGNTTCYCLDYDNIKKYKELLNNFLSISNNLNVLCC